MSVSSSSTPLSGPGEGIGRPPLSGLHHVRLPVSNAWTSRDWYMDVLGCSPLLDVEVEYGVVGVVIRHPCGVVIGLHQNAVRASALSGFAVLGFAVADRSTLEDWARTLEQGGVPHLGIAQGHLGWYLDVPDPDGIVVRLHTGSGPDTEEA